MSLYKLNIDYEFEDPEGEDLIQQKAKTIADIKKDNSTYFHYKDVKSIFFIFPEYVKQLTNEKYTKEVPGSNKDFTVLKMKELVLKMLTKSSNLDSHFSVKNIVLTTIQGTEMQNGKKVKFYDDSKPGEDVILEMHVNFKDVIALRICN